MRLFVGITISNVFVKFLIEDRLCKKKGSWKCVAYKGILSQTSSLAKEILFGNFSLGKGMLFGNLDQRKVKFW